MAYSDKLKDPRWQKKRLEILNRDKFQCQYCGDKEQTLHVHHFYYDKRLEPWEYDEVDLITVCEDCHWLKHLKADDEMVRFFQREFCSYWIGIDYSKMTKKDLIKEHQLRDRKFTKDVKLIVSVIKSIWH